MLAVTGDKHCLLGSQKGQIFLEEKVSLIAEFVQFCNGMLIYFNYSLSCLKGDCNPDNKCLIRKNSVNHGF